jgi:MFS family permease
VSKHSASSFTIVGELSLYCDKQFERNLIQSSLAFGAVAGLLIINYVSDTQGRKFGLLVGQFVAIFAVGRKTHKYLVTIIGGYTDSVPTLVASQFFSGFAGLALIIPVYCMPGEYCDDHLRQNLIVVINYSW